MNDPAPKFVSNADRRFVLAAAIAMCVVAWAYVVYLGRGMARMSGPALAMLRRMSAWQPIDLVRAFVMWAIMMVAMMLPSALPMLLLFASLGRRTRPPRPRVDSMAFLAAYIAVWSLFSAAATLIQWRLTEARLVSPMMDGASRDRRKLSAIFQRPMAGRLRAPLPCPRIQGRSCQSPRVQRC